MKSAHSCRICRRWLEGECVDATPVEKVELERQMAQGCCDGCLPVAKERASQRRIQNRLMRERAKR